MIQANCYFDSRDKEGMKRKKEGEENFSVQRLAAKKFIHPYLQDQ